MNPRIESERISTRFLTKSEVEKLLALTERDRNLGFFNCWTRKEAFIKAVGEGLSFPLDTFEVSLDPNKPARLLVTNWKPEDVLKWSIHSLSLKPRFVGSLVIEGHVENVNCWDWQNS